MKLSRTFVAFAFLMFFIASKGYSQTISIAEGYLQQAENFKKDLKSDSALAYYEKASADFQKLGKEEKFIHAATQAGIILTRQDQYEKAKNYLQEALSVGLSLPDTNNLLIATTYISLGVVCSAETEYDQSLNYHNKALAIRLLKLGENNADVAISYGNIGNVYLRKKDFQKSIDAHLKAMKIREKLFGDKSPEIAESYTGLGNAYRELKEYQNSLTYFEKALQNKIAQRGKDHKDLVRYYKNASDVYYLTGNQSQGDSYKAKADEITKR